MNDRPKSGIDTPKNAINESNDLTAIKLPLAHSSKAKKLGTIRTVADSFAPRNRG